MPRQSGHMTLNPVVHLGLPSIMILLFYGFCWGAMPVNPKKFKSEKWGEILVAIAGPLANLGLAFLCVCIYNVCNLALDPASLFQLAMGLQVVYLAVIVNLGLFFFNIIPIPPLDGFIVLSEFMPSFKPLRGSPFGMAAIVLLFIIGLPIWDVARAATDVLLRPL